ncbi:Homeobox protein knotted-1-like 4 [Zea mays]|jgi:hypothetical protein|uniref:Homeobox protein knotted-1-like 4 n=1 Tax=Zea mays TaxID=4577 RepID=A0A1D6F997_MAIZE|nr:Homeobox protein knotted-1-like 4 [Zea mays]
MDQNFGNLGTGAGSSGGCGGSNSNSKAVAAVSSSSFLQLPLSTAAAASPAYYGAPLALLHHGTTAGPSSSQQQQHQSPYAKHGAEMSAAEADAIKAKIVAHPQYSALLAAYLDCQKVGDRLELACATSTLASASAAVGKKKRT